MQNVRLSNGKELRSTYALKTIDGVFGLVLESWGPKDRNPDYGLAMEQILSRLIESGVPFLKVFVVSRNLTRALPLMEDRVIKIKGSNRIGLMNEDAHELRLAIGREVGALKEHSSVNSKGGNRFKRVLLHSPFLADEEWNVIASNSSRLDVFEPTPNNSKLELLVDYLKKVEIDTPEGSRKPRQTNVTTLGFYRDPHVKAWILRNANGVCEACSSPAPFEREDGSPYLEVHHLIPLSEGGADTTDNALAVCPNCHRRLHHGGDRAAVAETIRSKITRFKKSG